MSIKKRILFIAHDARRTGAIIVLKHHLEYFKQNPSFQFDIALLDGGPLASEFEAMTNVFNLQKIYQIRSDDLVWRTWNKVNEKLFRQVNCQEDNYYRAIPFKEYDIIYGNTIVSCATLKYAKVKFKSYTICHVHEMDYSIQLYKGKKEFLDSVNYVDLFLAASKSVRDNLIQNYGIPVNKIKIHYEYIPVSRLKLHGKRTSNADNDILRICGCGTTDWRKGMDVFIRAAYQLKKVYKETKRFHFTWIGARVGSLDYTQAMFDIDKLQLGDCITVLESRPDPISVINDSDLFFLTSREDPFPLVCLEAASLQLPIVCFEQAGGMEEFVNKNNGWVLPYLDIDAFVSLALGFLNGNKHEIRSRGLQASLDVETYDIEAGGEKLASILQAAFVENDKGT